MTKINVVWLRRDLRISDNTALKIATQSNLPILPIFIFAPSILNQLEDKQDRRVDYIHEALTLLQTEFAQHGITCQSFYGSPIEIFEQLLKDFSIEAIYCNHDYEPTTIQRDQQVKNWCSNHKISFHSFKDHVIFEKNEILKNDGTPYTVYTPYAKRWRTLLSPNNYQEYNPSFKNTHKITLQNPHFCSLAALNFKKTDIEFKSPYLNSQIITNYHLTRDFPSLSTTELGIALRFGTISIRQCVRFAILHNDTWLSELIWRDFFIQILYHFPKVTHSCFKSKYENIQWRNNLEEFEKWCNGETGYPIVDAGMRQLNGTGFMHNRVRMIVASFLCKHLLIDWRWGEAYFAQKLNDYDLAANNGNWQWAAGCGCDAAPYFRIFNPTAQTLKFDKELKYTQQWNVGNELTPPIVDHDFARKRCLEVYKKGLDQN